MEYSTDGGTTWSTVAPVAAEGANAIDVRQTDVAGNVSATDTLNFTLDTTAPVAPGIALDNDTGSSGVDNITNDGSYSLTGIEAGATVEYSTDGGTTWGTVVPVAVEGANAIDVRIPRTRRHRALRSIMTRAVPVSTTSRTMGLTA